MKLDGFLESRINDLGPDDVVEVIVIVQGDLGMNEIRPALSEFDVVEEYPFSRSFLVRASRAQIRALEGKDFVEAINEA
ncbi:MAG: hypothetical protein QF415_08030 [Candidatus Undinarchaeales archaeon]|jgi:hypothetical protein|nr:hypothetical protein [Candidatus Undinarchaeales archaeon]MDP7492985.1 hypothetical protein [Candidatus Undinarchaeales archaeon]